MTEQTRTLALSILPAIWVGTLLLYPLATSKLILLLIFLAITVISKPIGGLILFMYIGGSPPYLQKIILWMLLLFLVTTYVIKEKGTHAH